MVGTHWDAVDAVGTVETVDKSVVLAVESSSSSATLLEASLSVSQAEVQYVMVVIMAVDNYDDVDESYYNPGCCYC